MQAPFTGTGLISSRKDAWTRELFHKVYFAGLERTNGMKQGSAVVLLLYTNV